MTMNPSEDLAQSRPIEPAVDRFDDLSLPEVVRRGISDAGFTHCTPIQAKVLPLSLQGRDVAGQAQTGTGKTAAFLITVFSRLLEHGMPRRPAAPRALVIAPTRELAVQIASDAELLGTGNGLVVQAVYGGVDYKKQRENLRQDVDLLVGTPGRLIDYWKQHVYDLKAIEILVIDEADRMFDMGFIKDLRFLLRRCTPVEQRQSMLFSATLSHDVMELAYTFMNDAVRVEVKPEQVTAEGVEHHLFHVGKHEKMAFLLGLLAREGSERTLVFVNMRRTADHLCRTLALNGFAAEQITGDIEQRRRLRILEEFRDGTVPILVATDVASRGLHIDGVTHVINFDLPLDAQDYVHRVGRTARAGASGKAISLACEDYVDRLDAIEKLNGLKLPPEPPDDSMLLPYKHAPRMSRRRTESGQGRDGGGRHGREGVAHGARRRVEEPRSSLGGPRSAAGAPAADREGAIAGGSRMDDRRSRPTQPRAGGPTMGPGAENGTPDAPAVAAAEGAGARAKRKRRRRRKRPAAGAEPDGSAGTSSTPAIGVDAPSDD